MNYLELYCLILKHLEIFQITFCIFIELLCDVNENVVCMISVVSNLLEIVLWLTTWYILVNVPYALEKNMCSIIIV